MARSFTSEDTRRLQRDFGEFLARLTQCADALAQYRAGVNQAADGLIAQEKLRILQEIPVEELNRGKQGIRVKTLRDRGFATVADLDSASVSGLAAIDGISDEGARTIKEMVNDLGEEAGKGLKIRLSTDNKTPGATALVTALAQYRMTAEQAQVSEKILGTYGNAIKNALADIAPGQSGLRWLFTSREKKDKAEKAYRFLAGFRENPAWQEGQGVLSSQVSLAWLDEASAWADFEANAFAFFHILEELRPGLLGTEDSRYGLPEELAQKIQEVSFQPQGLRCNLRRYQAWGVKYILAQRRVLLGDEMGLGKTVQAIAAMVSLKNDGATHFLVVCPASVVENWCREITKHSCLPAFKIHGSDRGRAFQSWMEGGGVGVTTYETTEHFYLDSSFRFSMLTVDEAHYIKNPEAQRTNHVKEIARHAERLLFMTGTALENKVDEMISLISILQPEVAEAVQGIASLAAAPQFRKKIAPVYYRRKREDVLTELPDLIENEEWCSLTREEERVYEAAVLEKRYNDARRVSWNVNDPACSSKAARMLELIQEAAAEGRKVIVFTFFLDTIGKISTLLGQQCIGPITGSVVPQERQAMIDRFDRAPGGTVLTAQIQAGGTGLNIQSASVVILCEPQFKPSIENQAISRAYRMGQTRNVLVYRLLCQDTVDERIRDLLAQKQAAFDAFADESEAAKESLALDKKTFGNIMEAEAWRIGQKHQAEPAGLPEKGGDS